MGKSAGRAGVWSRLGARAERRPHPRRPGRRRTALGAGSQDVSGAPGRAVARSRCGAAGGGGGDADALAGQPLDCSGTAGLGIPTPPSSGAPEAGLTTRQGVQPPGKHLPPGLEEACPWEPLPLWVPPGTCCQVGCAQGSERMGSPGCHCLAWRGLRRPVLVYG